MEWLEPWHSVAEDAAQAAGMAQELRRELAAGHPLYGLPVRTLGRNGDDVLFAVEDGSGRVAVVHLTWLHSPPDRPPWPETAFYPSLQAWAAERMRTDHEDYLPMTEAKWLACADPARMLEFLGSGRPGRQIMLFLLACWRRLWPAVPDESREIIHKIEAVLEGVAVEVESIPWTVACRGSHRSVWEIPEDVTRTSWSFARGVAEAIPLAASGGDSEELEEVARRYHRRLLDCIFGNPFRPVVLTPTWQTANVVALAQAIYTERVFDRLPILADALEDAGCTDRDVLDHCRQPGEHARGCWVVDLVLGRA